MRKVTNYDEALAEEDYDEFEDFKIEVKPQPRNCLRCDKYFKAQNKFTRLCNTCKKHGSFASEYEIRIPDGNRTIRILSNKEMLRFHPTVENIALTAQIGQHAAKIDSGAKRMRLTISVNVAGKSSNFRLPRQRRIACQISSAHYVVAMWPLPHTPHSCAGKAGSV